MSGEIPRSGAIGDSVCGGTAGGADWPRKAFAVTMKDAGFDAGEGNPGLVIILQKRLGVDTAAVASSVGRGWSLYSGCCRSSVPGNPVALVAYPVVVRFHHVCRPCGRPYDRWGFGLTCARSAVRPLGIRPYLCQVGRTITGAPIPASDQLTVLGRLYRQTSCPKER
ncbi:hypothetical protein BHE74_00042836 [Ensete ventricosum]|nr:hypothetical protein BHE74_00042836 [Ensete ventricosum]